MLFEQALQELIDGNKRFVNLQPLYPNHCSDRRNEIAEVQAPFAAIVCCSDSRVPPEIIFDRGLGDLFVTRIAGNIINNEILGSIEYAVKYLGVKLIMVLGHENCGAINASIFQDDAEGYIQYKIQAIKPAVELAKKMPGDIVENSAKCNIERSINKIKSAKPILSKMSELNEITVVGAYYNLQSGVVDIMHLPV